MSDERDHSSIFKRISELTSKEKYKNPTISTDGYGSFIFKPVTFATSPDSKFLNQSNYSKEKLEVEEKIKPLIQSLNEVAVLERKGSKVKKETVNKLREAIRQADKILEFSNNLNSQEYSDLMLWVVFNLRFLRIINEPSLLINIPVEDDIFKHMLNQLGILHDIFKKKKTKSYEITDVEGIIQKICECLKIEHGKADNDGSLLNY